MLPPSSFASSWNEARWSYSDTMPAASLPLIEKERNRWEILHEMPFGPGRLNVESVLLLFPPALSKS